MTRTLQQVLDTGGPDLSAFASAAQIVGLGTMLSRQRRVITGISSAATLKLSSIDASIPGISPGGMVVGVGGLNALGPMLAIGAPSQVIPNGSTGLTVGAGNAAIRLFARDGYTVRYLQFGGAGVSDSTPTYVRNNQTLAVFVSISGTTIEVWVQLATSSVGVATSTPVLIKAALLASADAMKGITSIDFAGGTGGSAALDQIALNAAYGIYPAAVVAAGGSNPKTIVPGSCIVSHDGNLISLPQPTTGLTLDYMPAPRMPLDSVYDTSA